MMLLGQVAQLAANAQRRHRACVVALVAINI
eukprot:COSAG01_NODE_880_length_12937_cov_265.873968_14_plen_30_part_01